MIVITVSVCPASLKGDLTKWLFEISPGTYVGEVSARIRERLWERICTSIGNGRACMVYGVHSEMHFAFRTTGNTWIPENLDGITLMKHPANAAARISESEKTFISNYKDSKSEKSEIPDSYIILDVETTGLNPETDAIIEIAMMKIVNNSVANTFRRYVHTEKEIPDFIAKLTGITEKTIQQYGINPSTALEETLSFIDGYPVVCHNAEFDLSFLRAAARKQGIDFPDVEIIDTLALARRKIVGIPNYRLNTLIQFLGLEPEPTHEALHDCHALYALVSKLKEMS